MNLERPVDFAAGRGQEKKTSIVWRSQGRLSDVSRTMPMSNSHEKSILPGKIDGLLATLSKAYERKKEIGLQRVLVNSVVDVH